MEEVVLVDELDNEVGRMEKMKAHEEAILHRAFSIFIFNSEGEVLLQRRAVEKYHSGGLWTNTCCSHPRPGESVIEAANRRLMEEMGMKAEMHPIFNFIYKAELDHGLTEYELDHVLVGTTDVLPEINPEEVSEFSYKNPSQVRSDLEKHPERYTAWFAICFPELMKNWSPN